MRRYFSLALSDLELLDENLAVGYEVLGGSKLRQVAYLVISNKRCPTLAQLPGACLAM